MRGRRVQYEVSACFCASRDGVHTVDGIQHDRKFLRPDCTREGPMQHASRIVSDPHGRRGLPRHRVQRQTRGLEEVRGRRGGNGQSAHGANDAYSLERGIQLAVRQVQRRVEDGRAPHVIVAWLAGRSRDGNGRCLAIDAALEHVHQREEILRGIVCTASGYVQAVAVNSNHVVDGKRRCGRGAAAVRERR